MCVLSEGENRQNIRQGPPQPQSQTFSLSGHQSYVCIY